MSVGIASAVVGVYLSECAPANLRGTLMSNYNIIQNIGYVLAAGTVYGVVGRSDILNWLLPICLQVVLPVIIIAKITILPETPRWLAGEGRLDEAAAVIRSLRKRNEHNTEEKIWAEVLEIQAAYTDARALYNGSGWFERFKGANLRRTLIAIGLQSLQQGQGVSFVANYTVITLLSIGISNVYTVVLLLYVILLISSLGAFYFPDKLGRRTRKSTGFVSTDCSTNYRGYLWSSLDGGHRRNHYQIRRTNRSICQLSGRRLVPLGGHIRQHLVPDPMDCCR